YTMDRNGIQLRGDKVDITVNKDFNVMASRVDNKVGKNEIINRLNLSPEGLDIDVNKVGIRGGDSRTYLKLSQDTIELAGTFVRTWRGDTQKDNVFMRAQGGLLRFRNNTRNRSLYYSDFGISTYVDGNNEEASGTLQFFDYTYSTARGVTLNSSNGVAAVTSDNNRVILDAKYTVNVESSTSSVYIRPFKESRVGVNEFRFWTKLADTENETDGVLSYGAVTELPDGTLPGSSMGASLRFEKNPRGSNTVYATNVNGDIGTGDFYGNRLFGDWTTKNTNLYAQVLSELRVTDLYGYNGGNPNYKNLRVNAINTTSSYAFSNHSGADTYFGVGGGELIITNNNHYNGGDTKYRNIRFGKWYAMSSEKYKYDIKEWDYSVLDAFRNDLQLYSYKYKSEKDSKYIRNHHGVIIERELPIEWRHGDGFDGNEVMFWNTKAIQELTAIVDKQSKQIQKLEEQLNEQSITS
ncbi:tail fiber domain-containing protein, partial [Staphylococcus sp. FR124]